MKAYLLILTLFLGACASKNLLPPEIDKNAPKIPISPNYRTN